MDISKTQGGNRETPMVKKTIASSKDKKPQPQEKQSRFVSKLAKIPSDTPGQSGGDASSILGTPPHRGPIENTIPPINKIKELGKKEKKTLGEKWTKQEENIFTDTDIKEDNKIQGKAKEKGTVRDKLGSYTRYQNIKKGVKQEQVKEKEPKQEQVKEKEPKQEQVKEKEPKQEQVKEKEPKQEQVKEKEPKQEQVKEKEPKQEQVKEKEPKQEQVKEKEPKQEQVKEKEPKQEQVKEKEPKQEQVKEKEPKQEQVKEKEPKQEQVKEKEEYNIADVFVMLEKVALEEVEVSQKTNMVISNTSIARLKILVEGLKSTAIINENKELLGGERRLSAGLVVDLALQLFIEKIKQGDNKFIVFADAKILEMKKKEEEGSFFDINKE